MPVIHFRRCERSAAIHGCAFGAMDRHGLRPRDDEGILVISTSLMATGVPDSLTVLLILQFPAHQLDIAA